MTTSKLFAYTVSSLATAVLTLAACHNSAFAASTPYIPKVVNFTTLTTKPYGYDDTARLIPQVVLAGVSPSIVHATDTSFDVLALVRPGRQALRSVSLTQGGNPLFANRSLTHINTLENGDQFWKLTYNFTAGTFGNTNLPIQWGTGLNQFSISASDNSTQATANPTPFPTLRAGNWSSQSAFVDTTQGSNLSYNKTRRAAPQVLAAGVSPAVIDFADTAFDIVAIVRAGIIPVEKVMVKQGGNNLFNVAMQKKKDLNNGDQIWVANFAFAAGSFGTTTLPVVWGLGLNEYHIQVVDAAEQTSTVYPNIRAGNFPVYP